MKNLRWRLLIDPPSSPARNMAVDEALLRVADAESERQVPVLRFYQWSPSALSIGYGQRAAEFELDAMGPQKCGFVRRLTGGGAIFHHEELTFSLVASVVTGDVPRDTRKVYRLVNEGLIAGLKELGADVQERGCGGEGDPGASFCSRRVAPFDLVRAGRKLVGAAQRWTKRVVLEHGFVPLEPNPVTSDELSLSELLGRPVSFEETVDAIRTGFESALGVELVEGVLTTSEARRAEELTLQYAGDDWNRRR